MSHMKAACIRDLHIRTPELACEAEDGAVIVIEARGEPVADLEEAAKVPAAGRE